MSFIKIVKNEWPVDPEQIIITGYSMGGICTWYLADKYPGEFCAAIPMASSPMGFLTGKVPHYVIQGEFDQEFGTASVKRAVGIMKSKNRRAELVIADSLFHENAGRYVPYLRQSIPWINEQMINNK
jgi:dienelactone hydrolase